MWVRQTYEFAKQERKGVDGIFAGVTLAFERSKAKTIVFQDEWKRPAYNLSDQIRDLTRVFLAERKVKGVTVTLKDFKFADIHLTDEAVETAVRGCLTAAIEHFPPDVFKA